MGLPSQGRRTLVVAGRWAAFISFIVAFLFLSCCLQPAAQIRPVGRPSRKPKVLYASFPYQAASWDKSRRVVAKVAWHAGELFPRVGFMVADDVAGEADQGRAESRHDGPVPHLPDGGGRCAEKAVPSNH